MPENYVSPFWGVFVRLGLEGKLGVNYNVNKRNQKGRKKGVSRF